MKITYVRHHTVDLAGNVSNAAISFDRMTGSAVVIGLDTPSGEVQGLGFDSTGRYGHEGLINERFLPRIERAGPELLAGKRGKGAAEASRQALLRDEKEGGHGERSGAVGVLETALWDGLAKAEGMPLWGLLEREYGSRAANPNAGRVAFYASGGHYSSNGDDVANLTAEVETAFQQGYAWFKLKVGGATSAQDERRVQAAVDVAGDASAVAVDANGAFSSEAGHGRVEELSAIGLRWIEEPVGPLDFHALAMVASETKCAFATGENLFSTADVINLLRYGGLRPERDVLQMDIALSYGVTEFIRMLDAAQGFGWRPESFMPHAGHQLALHVSAGLGLGAHEVASAAGGRLAAYPLILKSLMGWPGSATAQARESSTSRRYCSVSGGFCEVRAYPHPSLFTPLAHPPGMTTRWKRSMSARP